MGTNRTLSDDQAFASAIERAYLRELSDLAVGAQAQKKDVHSELLDRSIYKADPTHGGLRYKKLTGSVELEARLLKALSKRLED